MKMHLMALRCIAAAPVPIQELLKNVRWTALELTSD